MIKMYSLCGGEEKFLPMLWRAAFLAKICNMNIPGDMEIFGLNPETVKKVQEEKYSEALTHLLILYGAGFADEDMIVRLTRTADKYCDIIAEAEDFAIDQCAKDEADQVQEKFVKNALMCVINSRMYDEIQEITFDTARRLCEDTYAVIRKGFLYIRDKKFLEYYVSAGEPLAQYTTDEKLKPLKTEEVVNDLQSEDSDPEKDLAAADEEDARPDLAVCLNIRDYLQIRELYGKEYAVEFIKHARREGIPVDEKFSERYEDYVRRNKMQFSVSAIRKKRKVCGELVNWFDYCHARCAENGIEISDSFDIIDNIDLTAMYGKDETPDYETLARKAAEEFIRKTAVPQNTVIEVMHGDNRNVYLYTGTELTCLDKENFRRIPFDYTYIWSMISEWSRRRIIRKSKDDVIIPPEEWEKIDPKDREFTKRLIEEQYSLKKQQNRIVQKLSEIRTNAEEGMNDLNTAQAKKDAYKAEQAEKNANRADGIEE